MDNLLVFTRQFLESLARGLSDLVMEPLLGVGSLEKALVESIQPLHQRLSDALPSTERRMGLAQLTRMPTVLAEAQIQDVLTGIPGIGKKEKTALAGFLGGMVQVARQRSRRLDDPKGKKLPGSWTLEEPEDLLGLLPTRPLLYRPGQRLGSYVLLRFIGADGLGETWKAGRAETPEAAERQAKREQDSVDADEDEPAPFIRRRCWLGNMWMGCLGKAGSLCGNCRTGIWMRQGWHAGYAGQPRRWANCTPCPNPGCMGVCARIACFSPK